MATAPSFAADASASPYDRQAELRALDATKAGVQGLVASGATTVPRIFQVADPKTIHGAVKPTQGAAPRAAVPVIDIGWEDHAAVVAAIRHAAAEWGIFLVKGHGVPQEVLSAALRAAKEFHDADGGEGSEKARLFSRDPANKTVWYNTNFDLYQSPVAGWRDSLYMTMEPNPPALGELPDSSRDVFLDYAKYLKGLQETLFGLLSEALGLPTSYLSDIGCNQGQKVFCNYYPPCPQPELAIGIVPHSDWGFLTVLLQNQFPGLQALHNDQWVDIVPTPGTFVVNIGDLLQLVSNDNVKSGEHRVLATSTGPRVSITSYPTNAGSTRAYAPIKELLSDKKPALYKETLASDYRRHCAAIGLGNKGLPNFKL
ncbi:unnamed protein product [Urochloa decumbens]|uniref:Fe2OG dioxygenase domain-containing protein n=1 Tax=Urochloa decumbens TaxID=240449 RepID=A0ABC9D7F1_9POAL